MNNLRNKVQLIGNLGAEPEIITFENGSKLAKISLATNEIYRNAKGEKMENTHWHRLIAWGKQAEIFEAYVKKGQEIAVEGKLVSRSYETKEGDKKYTTEIQIQELLLLGNSK
ncbi:MAG: single-stranded DNA-binding protein [Flavobacteriales bacterium]|jgi:single-strand DNA-binding protein|nr:single-stranded DNA-binding protein [Flavobacteriales bacterium]